MGMQIPLVDLRATLLPIQDELFKEFGAILERMHLFLGPNVQAFEAAFRAYCQVQHGVSVSSGTDALFAALRACDVGPGDEVIAPAHTFFATIEAIIHVGAIPVLVDVEPDTLTIDVDAVREAVTKATKAIVPVHLYGHPADMDPILQIAREYGLRVIEDAAQAHGARYKGRPCGSMGDAGCFSFYFTKNLGAFGEGGFITTADSTIAEKVRLLRHHGQVSKFEHAVVGHNLRMDELQAAVLGARLKVLEADNAGRRQAARDYDQGLATLPLELPGARRDAEHVYHQYVVRVDDRDGLRAFLKDRSIATAIHYPKAIHQQPAYAGQLAGSDRLPVTDELIRKIVSLPMYPQLGGEDLRTIVTAIRDWARW